MKKTLLLAPILLIVFAQSVLGQSAIETALAATVTIEVTRPDGVGSGSGFITSSDGVIVTAAHVMEGARSALVRLQNGEELNVEGLIEIDGVKDFAIVRVAGFDLPTVPLGNADNVRVGQRIIVIGAPIGLSGTVSDGLIAADRLIDGTRMIQISAPTSPGNSGGPVLTEQGRVIGLVVSGIAAEGAENLNFALPINYVRGQLALASTKPVQQLADVVTDPVYGRTFFDSNPLDLGSGLYEEHYPNGRLKIKTAKRLGEFHGLYEEYASDGYLISQGYYNRGTRCGSWILVGVRTTYRAC